jgi:hypothetical protein
MDSVWYSTDRTWEFRSPWKIYEDIHPLFLVIELYFLDDPRFLQTWKSPEQFIRIHRM